MQTRNVQTGGLSAMTPIPRVRVDPRASRRVTQLVETAIGGRSQEEGVIFKFAHALREHIESMLPEVSVIKELRKVDGPPGVVIEGLPTDRVGNNTAIAAVVSVAICLSLGEAFQYRSQNGGKIIAELKPAIGAAKNSNASGDHFGAHTDDAIVHESLRCHYIALYGVVNVASAQTGFAFVHDICHELCPEMVSLLMEPQYQFRCPASFGLGDDQWSEPKPVLWWNRAGELCVQIPTYNTRVLANSIGHQQALDAFVEQIDPVTQWVTIEPGTALVFRNDRGLHQRSKIEGDRLVLRTYWRSDLRRLRERSGSNGNVFDLKNLLHIAE